MTTEDKEQNRKELSYRQSGVDVEDTNSRIISSLEDQGFLADAETAFVTARPTMTPTTDSNQTHSISEKISIKKI